MDMFRLPAKQFTKNSVGGRPFSMQNEDRDLFHVQYVRGVQAGQAVDAAVCRGGYY